MQKIILYAALTLTFLVENAAAQNALTITGKVLDIDTQKPLAGICVALEGKENLYTKSNADGSFSLPLKSQKAGSAATLIGLHKDYVNATTSFSTSVWLTEKGANTVTVLMRSRASGNAAHQLKVTHYEKAIARKVARVWSAADNLKTPDERIMQWRDSITKMQSVIAGNGTSIPENLRTVEEVLLRPLGIIGLRAKKLWDDADIDGAIKILEEGKSLENWEKARKTTLAQANPLYNDALFLNLLYELGATEQKTAEKYKRLAMADTTNAEAAIMYGVELSKIQQLDDAEKMFLMGRRHCNSTVQNALMGSLMGLFMVTQEKPKPAKRWFRYVEESFENAEKGDEEATTCYKMQLLNTCGLMSVLSRDEDHLKKIAKLCAPLKTRINACGIEKLTSNTLGFMELALAREDDKAITAMKNSEEEWANCHQNDSSLVVGILYSATLQGAISIAGTRPGYRESEVLFEKQIQLYEKMARKSPALYETQLVQKHLLAINFSVNKDRKTTAKENIIAALPVFRKFALRDPAYYGKTYESLFDKIDKISDDEAWKEGIVKKELVFFEPLLQKQPHLYGSIASKLYMAQADFAEKDSTRSKEIPALYTKDMQLLDRAMLIAPKHFQASMAMVYDRAAEYYLHKDNMPKVEEIRSAVAKSAEKQYNLDKKKAWTDYLDAELNLIGFYRDRLYNKDSTAYRKSATTHLAAAEKILQNEKLIDIKTKKMKIPDDYIYDDDVIDGDALDTYVYNYNDYKQFFEDVKPADALRMGKLSILELEYALAEKDKKYKEMVKILKEKLELQQVLQKNLSFENDYAEQVALTQGALSWRLLFVKKYADAETAAQTAIASETKENKGSMEWVYSNLALSYLMQDRYKEALKIYKKYKGKNISYEKSWTDTFLGDLDALEEAEIVHKDFQKIRAYLNK
jgi:hypothetical protein